MRSFFVTKVVLVLTFLVSLWGFALADQNDTHGEYAFPEGDKVDTYNGILTFSRILYLPVDET